MNFLIVSTVLAAVLYLAADEILFRKRIKKIQDEGREQNQWLTEHGPGRDMVENWPVEEEGGGNGN